MKKPKQTREELLIQIIKRQHDQFSLMIDIMSDLPDTDKGEVNIFRKWLKENLKLIGKI